LDTLPGSGLPLPYLHLREVTTSSNISVLPHSAISQDPRNLKEAAPILGDLPFLGRFFTTDASPAATVTAPATPPPSRLSVEVSTLVQDGKLLFEMRKLDAAKEKLEAVLQLDPNNKAAKYYLELIEEQKPSTPKGNGLIGPTNSPELFSQSKPASTSAAPVETTATTAANSDKLFTRTFKLDPNAVTEGLSAYNSTFAAEKDREKRTKLMNEALVSYFAKAGAPLDQPETVFFNDRNGMLLVRASMQHLEVIESAVQVLNEIPPQVCIEAKFVEISDTELSTLGFDWFLGNTLVQGSNLNGTVLVKDPGFVPAKTNLANDVVANLTGILTDAQYRVALRALEQRSHADVLSAPKVTTLSGRPAQVSVVDLHTMVIGLKTVKGADGSSTNNVETQAIPCGPVLDVIPHVSADGYSIQLTLIATVNEFMGYEKPNEKLQKAISKTQIPLPIVRTRQATTVATVYDGQTVILGGMLTPAEEKPRKNSKAQRKNLLVFVTARLIDPAGNPVHTADEIPKAIPAQKKK
jgi:type II secretory pathway component GspD/PulD (secretin)